jgi:hypothetical protein
MKNYKVIIINRGKRTTYKKKAQSSQALYIDVFMSTRKEDRKEMKINVTF